MATKKDFNLIAESIAEIRDVHARRAACTAITDIGEQLNPRFKKELFEVRCNYNMQACCWKKHAGGNCVCNG